MSKQMDRYKYLLKNIGLLTIGSFSTKLLSFFLVPLYTSFLSTTEYGSYDLLYTTISLLVPIFTLNVMDGTLRFALDKEENKDAVFYISVHRLFWSVCLILIFTVANFCFEFISLIKAHCISFILLFTVTAGNGVISAFARGIEKIKEVSISSIIGSFVCILLNIMFLAGFRLGLTGYLWANVIGITFQTGYLLLSIRAWNYFHSSTEVGDVKKRMDAYSVPMIANNMAWWVTNASDRYVVTWLCGAAANGIYSVAYKIPSILSVLQTIFQQAWSISAVRDLESEDRDAYYSIVYNFMNFALSLCCMLIISANKFLASFLYSNDFFAAWQYVPVLLFAMLFSAMANFLGGIFQALKRPNIITKSTILSAVLNLVLNVILVYRWGAMGAAIATLFAYLVNWLVRLLNIRNCIRLQINIERDLAVYFVIAVQVILTICTDHQILVSVVGIGAVSLLFAREYKILFLKLSKNLKLKSMKNDK